MNDAQLAAGAGLAFERSACAVCGATNVAEAAERCRPSSDETGECSCPGTDGVDDEGYFVVPTALSIGTMDAAIERLMAAERAA